MRDIRASRWITLEKPDYTIEATAKQTAPGEIHVALREAGAANTLRPILAEAVAVFADKYPDSDRPGHSRSKTKSHPPGFPISFTAPACFTAT